MFKRLVVFFPILSFLFIFSTQANASIVVLQENGEVVINVLSYENDGLLEIPQSESLEIKDLAMGTFSGDSAISLTKNGENYTLNIASQTGEKSLNVTDFGEEIIEIEERPESKKLTISLSDGGMYELKQGDVLAYTSYDIEIEPNDAKIALSAPSGKRYISILPKDALLTAIRSKTISKVSESGTITLLEEDAKDIIYKIDGVKSINLANVYDWDIDVEAKVSASTGEIVSIKEPAWLKILKFIYD
jgi:hypothetical protein